MSTSMLFFFFFFSRWKWRYIKALKQKHTTEIFYRDQIDPIQNVTITFAFSRAWMYHIAISKRAVGDGDSWTLISRLPLDIDVFSGGASFANWSTTNFCCASAQSSLPFFHLSLMIVLLLTRIHQLPRKLYLNFEVSP